MRPSLRTIARAAGVSVSTVSLALRGLAKVDGKTRARIVREAERIGYVRDPQLAHALAFARRSNKPVYRETLAFVVDWPVVKFAEMPWLVEMREGIASRTARLGYGLEVVCARPSAREQRAQSRALHARGIRGLIIAPGLSRTPYTLDFDWSKFSAVEIGQTLEPNILHRIIRDSNDDYAAMFGDLFNRGYRRIGLAVTEREEKRHHWAIISSYLAFNYKTPGCALLPVLGEEDERTFRRWIRRERPDVIIANGWRLCDWWRSIGPRGPMGIGLCRIDAFEGSDSGLRPDYAAMGSAAVEALAANLERGEIGAVMPRTLLCIPNRWNEGKTLRPRENESDAARPA